MTPGGGGYGATEDTPSGDGVQKLNGNPAFIARGSVADYQLAQESA